MGLFKGGALRLIQTALYALLFFCAAIILGIFSYFLSALAHRNEYIPKWEQAVEGISGAATLYLIFAVLLTCCFGGVKLLVFTAILLDVLFCGGMIAIAVMTRHGASSCKGYLRTPLGNGNATNEAATFGRNGLHLKTACRLETAVFAVSLIAAFLFLCTAALQVLLMRHHKKEKAYGPGPNNNYTSGSTKKRGFFSKKSKTTNPDSELGSVGAGVAPATLAAGHHDMRPSHETGYTGSTVAAPGNDLVYDKVDGQAPIVDHTHGTHAPHGAHGGYYSQPQGTGVNPYGYENAVHSTTGTATNY